MRPPDPPPVDENTWSLVEEEGEGVRIDKEQPTPDLRIPRTWGRMPSQQPESGAARAERGSRTWEACKMGCHKTFFLSYSSLSAQPPAAAWRLPYLGRKRGTAICDKVGAEGRGNKRNRRMKNLGSIAVMPCVPEERPCASHSSMPRVAAAAACAANGLLPHYRRPHDSW